MSPRDLLALVRAPIWWAPKLLPVVAAMELAALTAGSPPGPGLRAVAATLVAAVAVAALAHLVNDLADVASDRAAGTPNRVEGTARPVTLALVAACAVVAVLPWLVVPLDPAAGVVLAGIVAVSLLYSLPPVRLKGRGLAGVLADASVAHGLPTAFAFLQLGSTGTRSALWWWATAIAVVWAFAFGIRSIVVHELADAERDRAAGVGTYVMTRGPAAATRLGRDAFGVEVLALVGLLAVSTVAAWGTAVFFVCHFLLWLHHRRFERPPLDSVPSTPGAWLPVAEFYEVWPAVVFGVALTVADRGWWPAVAAVVVVFWAAVSKQLVDELVLLWELVREVADACWALLVRLWWLLARVWWGVKRAWWAAYRAHWRVRHATVDPTVAFVRRQRRRVDRRGGRPSPPR